MTHSKSKQFSLLGIWALFLILPGCSNGQEYALLSTNGSGTTNGEVSVSEDNLGNTKLEIDIDDIGALSQSDTPKYYVAWSKSDDNLKRLGLVNVEDGRGELIAITDLNSFSVMISAESFPDVTQPNGPSVLESLAIIVE